MINRVNNLTIEQNKTALKVNSGNNVNRTINSRPICNICNKRGHVEFNCYMKNRDNSKNITSNYNNFERSGRFERSSRSQSRDRNSYNYKYDQPHRENFDRRSDIRFSSQRQNNNHRYENNFDRRRTSNDNFNRSRSKERYVHNSGNGNRRH